MLPAVKVGQIFWVKIEPRWLLQMSDGLWRVQEALIRVGSTENASLRRKKRDVLPLRGHCRTEHAMNVTTPRDQTHRRPVPTGFTPEGVDVTRFDERTRALIAHALPARYHQVFVHLLSYATTDPHSALSESLREATGESHGEAIALITSIAALSKTTTAPCGQETYLKALLILEALGIIRRIFHRTYTEIRLFLGKRELHLPTLLKKLDQLQESYRSQKVKHLARKVARRLQAEALDTASSPIVPDLAAVAQIVTSVLRQHGVENVQVPRLAEACMHIAQALQSGLSASKKGELVGQCKDSVWQIRVKTGDSMRSSGELASRTQGEESRLSTTERVQAGELGGTESPSQGDVSPKTRQISTSTGELDAAMARESPEMASKSQHCAQVGDSLPDVSISAQYLDILTLKERTLIDTKAERSPYRDTRDIEAIRREAKHYASLFDNKKSRKWTGSLIAVLKETPPEAKRSAAVATILYSYVRMPDGRLVRTPGGFFTDACKRYRCPEAQVPSEVRVWAETEMSLREIEAALQQGQRHPAQEALLVAPEASSTQGASQEIDAAGLVERTQQEEEDASERVTSQDRAVRVAPQPSQLRTWMTREDAERLRKQIVQEGRAYAIGAKVCPGKRMGEYVVVTNWDGIEDSWVNAAEWEHHFPKARRCYEIGKAMKAAGTYE